MKVITLSCRCRLTDLVPNVRQYSTVANGLVATGTTERAGAARLTAESSQRGLERLPTAA